VLAHELRDEPVHDLVPCVLAAREMQDHHTLESCDLDVIHSGTADVMHRDLNKMRWD